MHSLVVFTAFATLMTAIAFCVAIVLIVAVTGGDSTPLQQLLFSSLLSILTTGLWLAAAAVGSKRRRLRVLMSIAAAGVAIGSMFLFALIWWEDQMVRPDSEIYAKVGANLLLLSGAAIHAGVFLILPGRGVPLTVMKIMTTASVAVLAVFIVSVSWFEDLLDEIADSSGIGFWSLLTLVIMTTFLSVVGTAIVPIASLVSSRRQHRQEWLRRDVTLELSCPQCGHRQRVAQGRSRCRNCRATIIVELEEPRCACGYLLFELHGDTCPECGRQVDVSTEHAR